MVAKLSLVRCLEPPGTDISLPHLSCGVSILNVERSHSPDNGQDGLQSVAINDGNELEAFFQRITILVDNPTTQTAVRAS